jgi:hypothetical protein
MSGNKLFRTAGWCALVGALAMVAAVILFMLSGSAPIAGTIGAILEYISLLLLIIVFYALFIALRSESNGLSITGMVLLLAAILVDIIANVVYGNTTFSNFWYLLLSFPFLIYGYLGFRSGKMSRGFAVVGLLTGATYLISGVGGLLGSQAVSDGVSTIATLLMLVWVFWVWRVLWSPQISTTKVKLQTA